MSFSLNNLKKSQIFENPTRIGHILTSCPKSFHLCNRFIWICKLTVSGVKDFHPKDQLKIIH